MPERVPSTAWMAVPSTLRLHDAASSFDRLPGPSNAGELDDLLPAAGLLCPAAVLIGLVEREVGPQVLLTRRTAHLRHHAGQVSFPGGRIEPGDSGPLQAALREAEEEAGIDPAWVTPLGYLDTFDTITGFRVAPLVARVDACYQARPDPAEVEEVFEAPLELFMDRERMQSRIVEYRGRPRRYVAWDWQGRRIWGATAMMLLELTERLGAERP